MPAIDTDASDLFNGIEPVRLDIYTSIRQQTEGYVQRHRLPSIMLFPDRENHFRIASDFPPFLSSHEAMQRASIAMLADSGSLPMVTRAKILAKSALPLFPLLYNALTANQQAIHELNAMRVVASNRQILSLDGFEKAAGIDKLDTVMRATPGMHLQQLGGRNISQYHKNFVDNQFGTFVQLITAVSERLMSLTSAIGGLYPVLRPFETLANNDYRPLMAISPLRGLLNPINYYSASNAIANRELFRALGQEVLERFMPESNPEQPGENLQRYHSWINSAAHAIITTRLGFSIEFGPAAITPNLMSPLRPGEIPLYLAQLQIPTIFDSAYLVIRLDQHNYDDQLAQAFDSVMMMSPVMLRVIRDAAYGLAVTCHLMTLLASIPSYGRGNYKPVWTLTPSNQYSAIDAIISARLFLETTQYL